MTKSNLAEAAASVEASSTPSSQGVGTVVENDAPTSAASTSEPDADAIKMFVGQIPRHWNETDCRRLFETYGPVFSCNILRDKSTQSSKGCCFVTFYHRKDAIHAQGALHNIKVIEGMHHPIQMKPADTENRNERKLFVGQLSKKHTEEDLRLMFSKFGQIEDCSVLRDNENKSRGCAFVTFVNRSCAVLATKEMHHSQTMEGCAAPLVVKFADTQKDKDVKQKAAMLGASTSPKSSLLANLNPSLLQQLGGGGQNIQAVASILSLLGGQQPQSAPQQNVLGLLGSVLSALGKLAEPDDKTPSTSSKSSSTASPSITTNTTTTTTSSSSATSTTNVASTTSCPKPQQPIAQFLPPTAQTIDAFTQAQMAQIAHQNQILALQGYPVQQAPQSVQVSQAGLAGGLANTKTTSPVAATIPNPAIALGPYATASTAAFDPYQAAALQQQYALLANLQASTTATAVASAPIPSAIVGNGDVKGPEGANLFIYHLPQDFTDIDLHNTFAPFGTVLSAKVFIDKVTNLSKCFGFVSYDNATSANNAIQAMNGFQIGSKRLKVQLKVERGNPYNR
ncbi:unnamed protein product [Caenorhabditis bovis]|uniref:RRM domain-containing protein n=1 Tax=Caenorhabditis bovis TaxID=2654633 RepID=A0A8S1EUJ7_9PELO|nr:unnamed protein product [Caenorhabditis bovis]